jgi:predicted lipoprotein with Yx(FWY)xxD motif
MVRTKTVGSLGTVLVDARGMTLYHFDKDKAGKIACVGACTTTWPPLTISAGASVPTTPAGLSSVSRPDGSKQIAYQGKPLYTYSGDTKPGDANGDGFAGLWHAAKVSG